MPSDYPRQETPAPCCPQLASLEHRLLRLERDQERDHERLEAKVIAHDRQLVELVGERGGGTIGALSERLDRAHNDIKSLRKFQIKILLYAASGGGAGAAIFQAALQLLE